MKNVWLSSLTSSEETVQRVMGQMKTYGLQTQGHFWEDNLEKVAWIKPREELVNEKVALWAILGSEEDFSNPAFRYGLSVLTLCVQAQRGRDFPIVLLQTEGGTVDPATLPTPLRGVQVLSAAGAAFGAKLVAKVHTGAKGQTPSDYRLDLYGNEHIGQWFEIGPTQGAWNGGMFAVTGGEIAFHGVGPKGSLPQKSVLNYPMEGLKLDFGGKEYVAWAVKNPLDTENSYFVKVTGAPESILFGPYSDDEDTEMFVMNLQ